MLQICYNFTHPTEKGHPPIKSQGKADMLCFAQEEIMFKSIKAILIVSLAFIALIGMFPVKALAAESSFEPRLTAPSRNNAYYNRSLNVYAQTGYGMPNCTAYAYGRIYEITGEAPLISRGGAGDWWFINKRNDYYDYGSEPKIGAIACWSRHVAVVEAIDGDIITISQSHWGGNYFDTDTITVGSGRYGQIFYGFIYASDSVLEVEEEPVYCYKLEMLPFQIPEIQEENSLFPSASLAEEYTPQLLLNSRMLTSAVTP